MNPRRYASIADAEKLLTEKYGSTQALSELGYMQKWCRDNKKRPTVLNFLRWLRGRGFSV